MLVCVCVCVTVHVLNTNFLDVSYASLQRAKIESCGWNVDFFSHAL